MTTETEIHDALRRLETSINDARRHISRAITDDPKDDRLKEIRECLTAAMHAFDFVENFSTIKPAQP